MRTGDKNGHHFTAGEAYIESQVLRGHPQFYDGKNMKGLSEKMLKI